MKAKSKIESDGRTITVRVPILIRKRGGRKLVLAPDGAQTNPRRLFYQQVDNSMVKAIARGFRWRELLEKGTYGTITEIAAAESINDSYVGRLLRLTLLAPDVVAAIVEGKQPSTLQLDDLLKPFPVEWPAQRAALAKEA